jgi:hypothetical protein
MPTIHSGRSAVIEPILAPGRYALIMWLIDRQARHRAAHAAVRRMVIDRPSRFTVDYWFHERLNQG